MVVEEEIDVLSVTDSRTFEVHCRAGDAGTLREESSVRVTGIGTVTDGMLTPRGRYGATALMLPPFHAGLRSIYRSA